MRLTQSLMKLATEELLGMLRKHPEGLTTQAMIGTPKFHGHMTLSAAQIITLLRASGRATES